MAVLLRENDSRLITEQLMIAETFWQRLRGLIGQSLENDAGLWINPCRSIHTCLMNYSIDVVFVDSTLRITGLAARVPAWQARIAPRKTQSTIELAAGRIEELKLKTGNRLVIVSETTSEACK